MSTKLKLGKFKLRKSTPDLSEWGKNDAKLIEAVNKNDLNKISSILAKKGISPTKLDPSGQTVFHRAAGDGKSGAVQVFINNKADVNARDSQDKTPLHYACKNGHADVMKSLIRGGASPLYEDKDRQTPLHKAATGGHHEAVKLMMRLQDAPINIPDVFGQTPLHLAAQNGHISACEQLMDHGALLDFQDSVGRTPLMLACEKGHTSVVEHLAGNGVNVILNDKKGHNAMWYAVNFGRSDIERLLQDIPHNSAWDDKEKTTAADRQLYRERSVDSGHGGTLNGHHHSNVTSHSNCMDLNTAMAAMAEHSDDSDDDDGYMVPLNQHPETSRAPQRPQSSQVMDDALPVKPRTPPAKYDQQAYQSLEDHLDQQQAVHQRSLLEIKHLKSYINRLESQLAPDQHQYIKQNKDLLEDQIILLTRQLDDERAKTTGLTEKVKLLQFQLDSSDTSGKLVATTSEKDLRDMSTFELFQEAHKKEVDGLEHQIKELKQTIEDCCKENDDITKLYRIEQAAHVQMAEELGHLKTHIDEMRASTTSAPIDVDVQELMDNRAHIDYELLQVQDLLENLKNRPPGGPVDGSPFKETERLRKENQELLASNNDLQSTVTAVQQQLRSFQELANINDKLMVENTNLKHELDLVIREMEVARNRKPMIIDGPQELVQFNLELTEEIERLRQENNKLLSQLRDVQTDIEKTMSKLPSIEEFVNTQQDNEHMRRELEKLQLLNARQLSALQEAAIQKADLEAKIEEICDSHADDRHVVALKMMVDRLREHNEILEAQLEQSPRELKVHMAKEALHNAVQESPQITKLVQVAPVAAGVHVAASDLLLREENDALIQMLASLKEKVDILENERRVTGAFSLSAENEHQVQKKVNRSVSSASSASSVDSKEVTFDLKEVIAMREMINRLKEQNELLEMEHQRRPIEIDISPLSSLTSSSPSIKVQTSIERIPDSGNIALKEMVQRQKEYIEILESEKQSQAGGVQASISPIHLGDRAEVVALKEMVQRLKEQNEILELGQQQRPSSGDRIRSASSSSSDSSASINDAGIIQKENLALKVMVERLREQNETLEMQQPDKTADVTSVPLSTTHDVIALKKEIAVMKIMMEKLKEDNDVLEAGNAPNQVDITQVRIATPMAASPTTASPEVTALQKENYALKLMVERLKEQNEGMEAYPAYKNGNAELVRKGSTSSSESSVSGHGCVSHLKEILALQMMVERLREQNEILENQMMSPKAELEHTITLSSLASSASHEDSRLREEKCAQKSVHKCTRSVSSASSASSASADGNPDLKKQNVALTAMVVRLKEQIDILELEGQVKSQDIKPVNAMPTAAAQSNVHPNNSNLQKENFALKVMIERLKEQNDAYDMEYQPKSGESKHKRSVSSASSASSISADGDSDLKKEIAALKAMIERLKEQNDILELGSEVTPQNIRLVQTMHTSSIQSPVNQDISALQKENFALKVMIERLKEQNDAYDMEYPPKSGESKHKRSVSASSASSISADGDSDQKKEIAALKVMVERLKEQNDILESESQTRPPDITLVQSVPTSATRSASHPDISALQKENIALKMMIERLKEQNDTLDMDYRHKSSDAGLHRSTSSASSSSSASSVVLVGSPSSKKDNNDLQKENAALREMVERLKELRVLTDLEDYIPVDQPITQTVPIKAATTSSSSKVSPIDMSSVMKENIALKEMLIRLRDENDIYDAMHLTDAEEQRLVLKKQISTSRQSSEPLLDVDRENTALKEMVKSQREQIEILEARIGGKTKETDAIKIVQATVTNASPASKGAGEANITRRMVALEQMVQSLKERNEILETQRTHRLSKHLDKSGGVDPEAINSENIALKETVKQLKAQLDSQRRLSDGFKSKISEDRQMTVLRAMVASQRERIEILEAENPKTPWGQPNLSDDERKKMRAEIERLEDLLKKASTYNVDNDSDISELRSMTRMLNERNRILEQQVLQVTNVNRQMGEQMAVNEELAARNKGLESMIAQLTIKLAEEDVAQEPEVVQERIDMVHIAPVMTAVPKHGDDDLLGIRREKDALKEMVRSLQEQVLILETDLEKDRDQALRDTFVASPVSADLEKDNMRLRAEIVRLEGILTITTTQNSDGVSNLALKEMLESQREKIDILELELSQKPKEVPVEIQGSQESDALKHMIQHQREQIDTLQNELEQKPMETIKEVQNTKANDALSQMVESQRERIELLEMEVQDTREVVVEVQDNKAHDALKEIIYSQKERIQSLEMELQQKPKEVLVEVQDTITTDALAQMVQSQRERIELIERDLDIKPREVVVEVQNSSQNDALNLMLQSQKERIDLLELELEQKPKEVHIEVQDTKGNDALHQMLQSQKERIDVLEAELERKPKEIRVEIQDTVANDALSIMLQSQKERIELLELELAQKPKEVRVEVQDTKGMDALNLMILSQKERIEILETELQQKPKEIRVEVQDVKSNAALNQIIQSQQERIELLELELQELPREVTVETKDTKASDALDQMVQSQKERIELMEVELEQNPTEVLVDKQDRNAKEALQQILQSQRERIEVVEHELQQKPQEILVEVKDTKENDALQQIVQSQKEIIEGMESELQQTPKEIVVEVNDSKPLEALHQIVESQAERIDILELELNQKPEQIIVEVKDTKVHDALQQIVVSQKEQIDILEKQRDEAPVILETLVAEDTSQYIKEIVVLKTMLESLREQNLALESQHIKEEIIAERIKQEGIIEELTATNKGLESMIFHLTEEISDKDDPKETMIEHREVGIVHSSPTRAAMYHDEPKVDNRENETLRQIVESQKERISILESDIPEQDKSDISADIYELAKENLALKKIIDSQKERITILESEPADVPAPATSDERTTLALKEIVASQKEYIEIFEQDNKISEVILQERPNLEKENTSLKVIIESLKEQLNSTKAVEETPTIVLHAVGRNDLERENLALKQMVESLKEQLNIYESTEGTIQGCYSDTIQTYRQTSTSSDEVDALKQMVSSQRERILILESEKGSNEEVTLVSTTPVFASRTSSKEDDRELQHAQAIVKLNRENTALKQIVESLKDQQEMMEIEQNEDLTKTFIEDPNELRKQLVTLNEMVKSLKESRSNSEDSNEANVKDLMERNDNLSTINTELQSQLDALEEVAKLAEDMQIERNKSVDENQELNEEIFRLRQLVTFADDVKRERDNVIDDRARIQEELDRLKAVLVNSNDLEQAKYEWVHDKSQLESEIIGLKGTIGEQTKLLDGSEKHTESLEKKNNELGMELIHIKESLEKNDSTAKKRESKLNEKMRSLNQLLSAKDEELQSHEEQMEDIHIALIGAKEELEKKDKDLAKLKNDGEVEKKKLLEDNESLKRRVEEKILALTIQTERSAVPPSASVPETRSFDQNEALKTMVESMKEKNYILEAQIEQNFMESLTNEELQAKSKGLESMVFKLTEELASITSRQPETDKAAESKLLGENKTLRAEVTIFQVNKLDAEREIHALKSIVASQKERIDILEKEAKIEQEVPVAELIQFESVLPVQNAAPSIKDNIASNLEKENEALKEMVKQLKEANETLELSQPEERDQLPHSSDDTLELVKEITALKLIIEGHREDKLLQKSQENIQSDLYSTTLSEEASLKNEELLDENERLQENISRLQELLSRATAEGDAELMDENEALREMVTQLKESNETLENELEQRQLHDADRAKRIEISVGHQREVEALRAMIDSLKEDKEQLEEQLESKSNSASSTPPPIPTSPIPKEFDDHMRMENAALKAMIESLKEERLDMDQQIRTEVRTAVSSEPTSPLLLESKLKQENHALKVMVESQKERILVLENEDHSKCSPEFDKLTAENRIIAADVVRLESVLNKKQEGHGIKEIAALRAMIDSLKEENDILQAGRSTDVEQAKDVLKKQIKALQFERQGLLDSNELLNGQITRIRKDLENIQIELDQLRTENQRMTVVIKGDVQKEELLVLKKEAYDLQFQEREIDNLKDTVKDTAFEKIQLNGEVDVLKEKIETLQKELVQKDDDAMYLRSENKDLRVILHTIQEANRIPPDHLARKMKEENHKLQNFIEMLETKVDRILSPGTPQNVVDREKLTLENQLTLLQKQLEDERRKHAEIVNTYRSHLLAAVQGHIDPEVKQALQHIITLRQPQDCDRSDRSSVTRGDSTSVDANTSYA